MSSESFVIVNKDSMTSCSIVNIAEVDKAVNVAVDDAQQEKSTSPATSSLSASSGAAAIDPKVFEYFKLVRDVSQDESASGSAPASLAALAAKVMDKSASEQWNEWSALFEEHVADRAATSLPVEEMQSNEQVERKCVSLEKGIEMGAQLLAESINSVVEDTDNEAADVEVEPFEVQDPLELYIRAVREENEKLKQLVEQNNEAMKKQLKTVQSWQEEVNSTRTEIALLKQENQVLRSKISAGAPATANDDEGSFIWDSMTSELGAMKSQLDRVPQLEQLLQEKQNELEEVYQKLSAAKTEVKALNLQVAELRIARIREQDALELMKTNLELSNSEILTIDELRKKAEVEVAQLEKQLSEVLEQNSLLQEKLERGAPVLTLPIGSTEAGSERHHHGRRAHRAHKKHMRRVSDNIVAGVGAGLVLESFRQYRAT